MKDNSHYRSTNILPLDSSGEYIEELYAEYLNAPSSVPEYWRDIFSRLGPAGTAVTATVKGTSTTLYQPDQTSASKQSSVLRLINAYRVSGHKRADTDPLKIVKRPPVPDLDPSYHGLDEEDMDTMFHTGSLFAPESLSLREILQLVRSTYTGSIGAEYMHIASTVKKRWIQERLETRQPADALTDKDKVHLLEKLTAAEGLEQYLHSRYVGQKRFSIEGGESMIPLLDHLIQHAGKQGVREIVLGMAHRGRLNVLINIMGKSPSELFMEFEGRQGVHSGSGDVKYHQGFSSDIETEGGPVHLALAFNPSHLEVIDPVVVGAVKARQIRRNDVSHEYVLPVLVHGDAAFSGQGVVMETLNMSLTRGFHTGGTVHLVHNNQIGFTTSHPLDARSTPYCTEIAKMVEAPIFHVNGDDPEAVVYSLELALDYRKRFKCDVVVDMICYRRHGHSEADEPSVTQPLMYSRIRSLPTTREIYARKLQADRVISDSKAKAMQKKYRNDISTKKVVAENILSDYQHPYTVDWSKYRSGVGEENVDTSVSIDKIQQLWSELEKLPEGFALHPRVESIMADRRKMASGALPINWGFAEIMAYATLIDEGYAVRLSGQDSGRGTFFHRHAILHDQVNGDDYIPLKYNLVADSSRFQVIDSLLSEEAVLGFELGYATAEPQALVIWEAQFGDFANGAQVFIDQFISSAQSKWDRLTGLTLFLPHGFEGQGPEHSSARLERYLQLCAESNMTVCVPTTAAQIFHLLRTQMLHCYRRPLIVMSPKSMLRNPLAASALNELEQGGFMPLIPDQAELDSSKVRRVILCTGKVYYDLYNARRDRGIDNIAIIRVEQLYPFPRQSLVDLLDKFDDADSIIWCQEEPMNQGAWYQVRHHLEACTGEQHRLSYVGREPSAAPAAGSYALHLKQLHGFIDEALSLEEDGNMEHKTAFTREA